MDRSSLFPFLNQSNDQTLAMLDEEQMKSLIVQHRPKLMDAFESGDFVKATDEIRQFASMSLLWNPDGLVLPENVDPLKQDISASQFHYYFATGEMAVNEKGAAAYLASLYRLFSFFSGWYRVGVPGYYDHGLTIVAIPAAGDSLDLIVQDPILQTGYSVKENGSRNILHVFETLENIGANGINPHQDDIFPIKQLAIEGNNEELTSYLSGKKVYTSEVNLENSSKWATEKNDEFLKILPTITNRPAESCGLADAIRFALTDPVTGEAGLDQQISSLFKQMRERLQRKFDPSNLGFDVNIAKPHEAKKEAPIPIGDGWKKLDNGYSVRRDAYPDDAGWVEIEKAHKQTRIECGISADAIEVSELEEFALAHALQHCGGRTTYMIELGSGFGKGCLEATSLVSMQKITPCPTELKVAAIEAEPNHYKWTRETFDGQGMGDKVFFGAVSGADGDARFLLSDSSQNHYGQSIKPHGNFVVPAYSLDTLFKKTGFPKLDILHLDIQGAETDVLWQARDILTSGLIDFIVLGTHGKEIEQELRGILAPTHELLIAVDTKEEVFFPTLNEKYAATVDGFQYYRRWGL